jgi:competence protein ComEC
LDNIKIPRYIYHRENIGVGNSVIYILNDSDNKYFDELSSNDKSGFLKIVYDKTSFLFVGDAEIPAESYYLEHYNNFLDSDVLKVGHHGSKTGSTYEFLQVVSPKISLISAGIKNKFGHPSDVVLQRLNSLNSKVFRTDSSGAVLLQSDGQKIIQIDWKNL